MRDNEIIYILFVKIKRKYLNDDVIKKIKSFVF
jgi:hypothetical protein